MTVRSNSLSVSDKLNSPPTCPDEGVLDLFSELPVDVLGEILSHLTSSNRDILNLSLTSKGIHHWILPSIFHSIEIRDASQCLDRMQYLISQPRLARTVVSIVLRPNFLRTLSKKRLAMEAELSRAVELLAPNLFKLKEFVWDGLEVPPSRMWASLRHGCPNLKAIGTNLGLEDLDPDSELFAFDDLLSFSLTTELHCNDMFFSGIGGYFGVESLPQSLWTMLVDRSPRLRSLVIGDGGKTLHCPRKFKILPITAGRWRRLESLTISHVRLYDSVDQDGIGFDPRIAHRSFRRFMHAHSPSLRRLKVHRIDDELDLLPVFRECSDTVLTHRSCALPLRPGRLLSLHTQTLVELDLTDKAYRGPHCHALKRYLIYHRQLRKLALWIDFSQTVADTVLYNQIANLKDLLRRCPQLYVLKVICSTRPKETFLLQDFARVVQNTFLREIELCKCRRYRDVSLKAAAQELAQCKGASPYLESVVLTACRDRWDQTTKRMQVLETGVYRFHRNDDWKADLMMVKEQRNLQSSSPSTKRYEMALTQPKTKRSI